MIDIRGCLTNRRIVLALYGVAGVGKSQMAIEYTQRFHKRYRFVCWIDAERAELIPAKLADFASAIGMTEPNVQTSTAVAALRSYLHRCSGWLFVFDNAQAADDVAPWLPEGDGHILITSRSPAWRELGDSIEVSTFSREESSRLLSSRKPGLSDSEAGVIANALGDFPLALAQAAAVLAETDMSTAEYLRLLATRTADVLDLGKPIRYQMPMASSIRLAVERIGTIDLARTGLDPMPLR